MKANYLLPEDLQLILYQVADSWLELRNKNIFITGGTGFIGSWLLESFKQANEQFDLNATVTVLTRNHTKFAEKAPHLARYPKIRFIEGDIESFKFPSGQFSHIIHAATETSHELINRDPIVAFEKITRGMQRVLKFAEQGGANKLLFTSSGAVYGEQSPDMIHMPERYLGSLDLFSPQAAYGEGKRVAEMLSCFATKKLSFELKIARCFTFVGPYMPLDQHFAIGNFIRDALHGGPIIIQGDGTPFRSYLYAADMAAWLWTILFRGENCRPYNVGSDDEVQLKDCAEYISELIHGGCKVVIRGVADKSRPLSRYVPDINRARRELGLSASISLKEALLRTIKVLKRNNGH